MAEEELKSEPKQEYTVKQKATEEANKLFYDTFKHLTTLSTGSILILVALLDKVFEHPQWKALIVAAFVSFIISTLSSILMMFVVGASVEALKSDAGGKIGGVSFLVTIGGFLLGIISLVIFAIKNFFH